MKKLIITLVAIALAVIAAKEVLGQVVYDTPTEATINSLTTITFEVGKTYHYNMTPTLAHCKSQYPRLADSAFMRRSEDSQWATSNRRDEILPSRLWRGLRVQRIGSDTYIIGTALSAGTITFKYRVRYCLSANHEMPSLFITITGAASPDLHPHAAHYGLPLVHHEHSHVTDSWFTAAIAANRLTIDQVALSLGAAVSANTTLLRGHDHGVPNTNTRVGVLEEFAEAIWEWAENSCTAQNSTGNVVTWWDRSKTSTIRNPSHRFPFAQHCCQPPEPQANAAAAWAICAPPASGG